jgi:hypothetical protein
MWFFVLGLAMEWLVVLGGLCFAISTRERVYWRELRVTFPLAFVSTVLFLFFPF